MYESKQTILTLEDVTKYKDNPQRFIEYLKRIDMILTKRMKKEKQFYQF